MSVLRGLSLVLVNTDKQNSGLLGMAVRCSVYKNLKKDQLTLFTFSVLSGCDFVFFLKASVEI